MLFKLKLISFWDGGGIQWAFCGLLDGEVAFFGKSIPVPSLCGFLQPMTRYMLIALYLLVIVGLAVKYRDKAVRHDSVIVFANQIFVTLGVYLLIEVQARYAYSVQISVAILAALGLSLIKPKNDTQSS